MGKRSRVKDDDQLDGCGVDFVPHAIKNRQIARVVLGDDRETIKQYRELFPERTRLGRLRARARR